MPLTKKKEIYCKEYVKTDNKSLAYRIAYDTENMKEETVHNKAYALSQEGEVRARIKELQGVAAEIADKEFKTDSTELLRHLTILRKSRIDEYVDFVEKVVPVNTEDADGEKLFTTKTERVLQFKPFDQLTEEQLMCIESIKDTRNGIELKLHGKDWTIDKIAKHIGFYGEHNKQKKPESSEIDYSKYSVEELKELRLLLRKGASDNDN